MLIIEDKGGHYNLSRITLDPNGSDLSVFLSAF